MNILKLLMKNTIQKLLNFKEQGHILINLFSKREKEVKSIMNKIQLYKSNDNSMIKRIRPNFYLEYFENSNEISLFKCDLNIKYELWKTNIINKSSIFSISNSIHNDEIYICLND